MKNVRIRSFSGRYFHALELRTEIYSEYLRIQSKCGKMRTRKTLEQDTFYEIQTSCEILRDIRISIQRPGKRDDLLL